jgi:hypothetical protein
VARGDRWDKKARTSWSLVDPRTGARVEVPAPPPGVVRDASLSPDGRRRVTCTDDAIIVADAQGTGKNEQRFTLDAEDHRALAGACAGWASARYLRFDAGRLGFLDADTMKVSYPFADGEVPPMLAFDADFTSAYTSSKDAGIRVGRVVVR